MSTSPAAGSGRGLSTTLVEILPGWSYTAALYVAGRAVLAMLTLSCGGFEVREGVVWCSRLLELCAAEEAWEKGG